MLALVATAFPSISWAADDNFGTQFVNPVRDNFGGEVGGSEHDGNGNHGSHLGDLGWEAGVDLLFFNVYANHGVGGTGQDFFEDFDMSLDGRYWFGVRRDDGLGLHMRFFEFKSYTDFDSDADQFVDVTMLDLEGSAVLEICDWQLTGIAGLRYGKIEWFFANNQVGLDFEGVGVALGGEVRRMLGSNLAVVGRCRYSVLYGETKQFDDPDYFNKGTAVHGLETSLGVEWSRCTQFGLLTLGAGWEQQLYSSLSHQASNTIDPEDVDITLAGPVISASIRR